MYEWVLGLLLLLLHLCCHVHAGVTGLYHCHTPAVCAFVLVTFSLGPFHAPHPPLPPLFSPSHPLPSSPTQCHVSDVGLIFSAGC